jgi:hypothetical protein
MSEQRKIRGGALSERTKQTSLRALLRVPNLVVGVAVIAALAGSGLALGLASAEPVVTAGNEARSGELSLWVMSSEWLEHDHGKHTHDDDEGDDDHGDGVDPNEVPDGSITDVVQGFQMPGSMSPGTPDEGFQRLQVNVTMNNRGRSDRRVATDDFALIGKNGSSWTPLTGGTFVPMTVPPEHAFSTIVVFDVPSSEIDDDLYVEWNWSGTRTRLTITETDGHDHG